MGSLGAPEILVILVVALLVLGPERLPEAARQAGRFIAEARRMSAGFQAELRDAMNTPVAGPPVPPGPSPGVQPAAPQDPGQGQGQRVAWDELPPT
jgi:TatA/E family protein of Tat protein translocase